MSKFHAKSSYRPVTEGLKNRKAKKVIKKERVANPVKPKEFDVKRLFNLVKHIGNSK
jgi:hypothetical protein